MTAIAIVSFSMLYIIISYGMGIKCLLQKYMVWLLIFKITSMYFVLLDMLLSLKSPSIWAPITLTNQLPKFRQLKLLLGFKLFTL